MTFIHYNKTNNAADPKSVCYRKKSSEYSGKVFMNASLSNKFAVAVRPYTADITNISPVLLMHIFTPVLVFRTAFQMEKHAFLKSFSQGILLAVPGLLINCLLTAFLAVKVYPYNWDWYTGMLFGAILSSTDSTVTTDLLKNLGTSRALTQIVSSEPLFNDGTSVVLFEVFRSLAINLLLASMLAIEFILKFLASPVFGYLMAMFLIFWLSHILEDGLAEVSISLAMTYITFYVGEWTGMSGVISVASMGIKLNTVHFSPGIEVFLLRFWDMLTYLVNTLIFVIAGVLIAERCFEHLSPNDGFYILILYCAVNIIRFIMIVVLSPLLSHLGYGFNWHWAAVTVWSGIRGVFALNLALIAFQSNELDQVNVRNKILLHSSGTVILTLLVNATTMESVLLKLGLSDIPTAKRMAMYNAVKCIQESKENTLFMLKMDRFMANANWAMVEEAVQIEDPYKTTDSDIKIEEFSIVPRTGRCPDCDKTFTCEPSPHELADMMEEARLRILKVQKTSYWKQYNTGMLNRESARTLINMTESLTDESGKFISILDMKKFWDIKGVHSFLKKKLDDWLHERTKITVPPKNKILKMCYKIVFNSVFDNFIFAIILLNMFPILLECIPMTNIEYVEELRITNDIFFALYLLEIVLKASAMRNEYISNHWNQFDILLIVIGMIDIIIDRLHSHAIIGMHVFSTIRVFKVFRLIRALRLLKILLPKLITIVDNRINKQLAFGYEITKGYILGEEDTSKLIDQISDHKLTAERLKNTIDMNRQEVIKELGFLQGYHPETVISVKTRQSIRIILNNASDTIQVLMSTGLLDDFEAKKLQKMIEAKMKKLSSFPLAIAPPVADDLLGSVPWLENSKNEIQYLKKKSRLLSFETGEIIIIRGQEPQGIYLIVSGMVKLHGSRPRVKYEEETQNQNEDLSYTDYRSSGSIIGELNCLTKQKMQITVFCEINAEMYLIPIADLFEAFHVFSEHPSLQYKMWRAIGVRISIDAFMENTAYQTWTYHKMCAYVAHSYILNVDLKKTYDVYDGGMEDVVLFYGTVEDCQTENTFVAPCILPKTTHQVRGTSRCTKLLIVPSVYGKVKETHNAKLSNTDSVPCLRHAAARRRGTHFVVKVYCLCFILKDTMWEIVTVYAAFEHLSDI
ncbi:sodium/hydrogen exchanger 10 [Protopterus annectens]|uniref:sodium/hydrogen exchanger 10 n=1 Tax=Protopterus annectens TaxID=7888 RepID=UPI001CF96D24|nr:sodium/hydrogen exchanger 10 [Protopterus annectens]